MNAAIPSSIYLLKVNNRNTSVSVVNSEHVIAGWDQRNYRIYKVE